ncbi:MAG TPA: hypothetical protein VG779_01320 [Actinomycetota bacterium]|nr:hypothetical protein [Actinomycetota bacterium]
MGGEGGATSETDDSRGYEVFGVRGNPTPEEEAAILEALDEFLGREQQGGVGETGAPSLTWKLAGRLAARRGGILDARSSLGRRAWPASARIVWSGRAHQGRLGRGESR